MSLTLSSSVLPLIDVSVLVNSEKSLHETNLQIHAISLLMSLVSVRMFLLPLNQIKLACFLYIS